jgi:hypothetical protein
MMPKIEIFNACKVFLDRESIRNEFVGSADNRSLMVERDSIVQHYPSKGESNAYQFLLHLLNNQLDASKVRVYWSMKNDDYLFLDCLFPK